MACIKLPTELQAELVQLVTEAVIAAVGDKERARELFADTVEQSKGPTWLGQVVFDGIVEDVKFWNADLIDIKFTDAFGTKHGREV
jgi:hypothetical protein